MNQMEEPQELKYICKFCNKCCSSGKSLGGHMRVHLALIQASKKQKYKAVCKMDSDEFESSLKDQEKANNGISIGDNDDGELNGYGLRDNPRKSWRVTDITGCSLNLCKECGKEFGSMRALAGHIKTHSKKCSGKSYVCEKCDKGFGSMRALFGHMKVHSKRSRVVEDDQDCETKQGLSDFETVCPIRKKRSKIRYNIDANCTSFSSLNNESVSAVSELDEMEEAAKCLMMLSLGVREWDEYVLASEYLKNENAILESESFHCAKGISEKIGGSDSDSDSDSADRYEKNCDEGVSVDELFTVNDEFSNKLMLINTENDPSSSVVMEDIAFLDSCSYKNAAGVDFHGLICDTTGHKTLVNSETLLADMVNSQLECIDDSPVELIRPKPIKSKRHECPICFKVFPSGQSLGGHKRAHYTGFIEGKTKEAVVKKLEDLADNNKGFDLNNPVNVVDEGGDKDVVELKLWWVGSDQGAKALIMTT